MVHSMSRPARLCWYLDAHRWTLAAMNIAAAALFVVGCVGFFWPSLYLGSVILFLLGSLLFLLTALGAALLEHGPST
jgi:apolipoprotein N-acyltransferase